ncbi:MAG TPA: DUF5685 family protein [Lachnospiraceae bacterium]|nr:DUF5685 family protein [Lachnospiraceae bacterium]
MFGYVIINKQEMKFKEYEKYRSYYCGLCRSLKEQYGFGGQISLSYDMTFIIMLLTALYEPDTAEGAAKCIAHPFEKHKTRRNLFTEYAADMNLLLTYEKCLDDWNDERKLLRKGYADSLLHRVKKIKRKYPGKAEVIRKELAEIREIEERNEKDIDLPAEAFGRIMAEILAYRPDEWEKDLRETGFYLGKFIYLMDAYEDMEKDEKTGNYNPFLLREQPVDDDAEQILLLMMADCSRAFERLPIVEDVEILRNILYSGVWCRYRLIREKKNKKVPEK